MIRTPHYRIFSPLLVCLLWLGAAVADDLATVGPSSLALTLAAGETVVEEVSITINPLCFRPFDVDVVAPNSGSVAVTNQSGIQVNSCGGDTTSFNIEFVGGGSAESFDLQFVDAEFGGELAVIPVTVTPAQDSRQAVLSCFYECKAGKAVGKWREVTTLMLTNDGDSSAAGGAAFFDGNETLIAQTNLDLSGKDLDELYVCKTLADAGVAPPSAGLIEIFLLEGGDGAHAWIKNLLGEFKTDVQEPFDGRLQGVAKTPCRVVPESVTTAQAIAARVAREEPPFAAPVLIEDTAD